MANAYKYQWTPDEAIEKLYQKGFMDGTNVGFLQTLIDNTIEIEANSFFWQEPTNNAITSTGTYFKIFFINAWFID